MPHRATMPFGNRMAAVRGRLDSLHASPDHRGAQAHHRAFPGVRHEPTCPTAELLSARVAAATQPGGPASACRRRAPRYEPCRAAALILRRSSRSAARREQDRSPDPRPCQALVLAGVRGGADAGLSVASSVGAQADRAPDGCGHDRRKEHDRGRYHQVAGATCRRSRVSDGDTSGPMTRVSKIRAGVRLGRLPRDRESVART